MQRGILAHVILLAVATAASVFVWTRDKKPAVTLHEVTVWNARASDIERIAFESKARKVTLEAHSDAQGRWFLGAAGPTAPAAPGDGGAPAAPKAATFVSVSQANKLAEALAPLKAVREVGKIADDRSAEFGLKEPEGSVTVTLAGKTRGLTLGGRTQGGGDRYVRDDASGTVYVVKGEVTRDIEAGEGTLTEREMHAFKDADVESIRVLARGKTRDVLRRGPDSKRIWADPSDPEKADETVSNWIAKVDRLHPTEYPATQPSAPELVVRIEVRAKGAKGAFLEVAKVPGASADKPDFLVRTEYTRQWAKVYSPVAEQVEQDLASVLR